MHLQSRSNEGFLFYYSRWIFMLYTLIRASWYEPNCRVIELILSSLLLFACIFFKYVIANQLSTEHIIVKRQNRSWSDRINNHSKGRLYAFADSIKCRLLVLLLKWHLYVLHTSIRGSWYEPYCRVTELNP